MTILVLAVVGGFIGFSFFDGGMDGAAIGAAFGALAGWLLQLGRRVEVLEQQLERALRRSAAGEMKTAAESVAAPAVDAAPASGRGPVAPAQPVDASAAARAGAEAQRPAPAAPASSSRAAGPAPQGVHAPPPYAAAARPRRQAGERPASQREHESSPIDVLIARAKRWLTTGNVPVKVGVILSVFGVAFLVKEGIDRNWLVLPLPVRLALVAAFGIALLAIGWRLRTSNRTYAVSVQGGGIAVLYLTTYASFALYDLLPAALAFGFLVCVTAAAGALAVLQNSRALAVLGIVGGFMAPVLTSSSAGNHVALFGYYAVLNLAILGIAWFKAWRELNVLGFFFTFFIGALWGYEAYTPERFASTEPFLIFFVALYTLVPVLFALRSAPQLRGFVDGTLVFGTPIVGFGLQSQLVDSRFGLALSALALALWYIALATYLARRKRAELAVLVESLFALAVAFATVAVPLALDARWTSAAWALQGAAMVWLGFRQNRKLALAAGCALQVLGGASYFMQPFGNAVWPVVNGYYIGAVLIAAAGWYTSSRFDRARGGGAAGLALGAAAVSFVWASAWWLMAGFAEIDRHVTAPFELAAGIGFVALTTLLAMAVSRAVRWPKLDVLGLVLWPFAVLACAFTLIEQPHPFARLGWLAWPSLAATAYVFLRLREASFPSLRGALHAIAYWVIAFILALETHWVVDRYTGGIWPFAAVLAVLALLVLATLQARSAVRWPVAAHAPLYVSSCAGGVLAVLAALTLGANAALPGDPTPLPYLPLLNPLELTTALVVIVGLRWLRAVADHRPVKIEPQTAGIGAALVALFVLTMAVARAVHHYTGVAFDANSLAASSVLQTALSIVWGIAGLTGMMLGARRKQRAIWIGGAALMAVVVVKLFLVELDNTGTLGRVVSFLGVGLLLLVVGYFAPVPPRAELDKQAA